MNNSILMIKRIALSLLVTLICCNFNVLGAQDNQSNAVAESTDIESSKSKETKGDSTLAVPKRSSNESESEQATSSIWSSIPNLATKVGIVAGICILFLLMMSRKQENRGIPKEAIEIVGKVPYSARQTLQLVRFGRKLVLVEASNSGLKPISEITDPLEVQHMLDLVRPGS